MAEKRYSSSVRSGDRTRNADTGRHFDVDNRYNDSYVYRSNKNKRPPPRRRRNRRSSPAGPILGIVTALVVLVCIGIVAKNIGLFDTVLGKPDVSESPTSESAAETPSAQDNTSASSESAAEPTVAPEVTPIPKATLPPVEGGAEYTTKYPEMWVPQPNFAEVDPDDKVVYLTFDDGPCDSSDRLLSVLDELDVKATFFYTAQFASDDDIVSAVKKAYDKGHAVAVHTYSHNYGQIYASVDAYLDDFKKMDDLLVRATGEHTRVYRHPGGSNAGYNEHIRYEMLKEMNRRGFVYYDWNLSNDDAAGADYDTQVSNVLGNLPYNNRNIILMHNTPDKGGTIDSLYTIVPAIKEQGYRFGILDETVKPIQFSTVSDYEE